MNSIFTIQNDYKWKVAIQAWTKHGVDKLGALTVVFLLMLFFFNNKKLDTL